MNHQSFSTIDSLLEFGMSIAVAQQMIRTMNHAINNMQIPGSNNHFITPPLQQYYAVMEGVQSGPMTVEEIQKLVMSGRITKQTLLWKPGSQAWVMAESMPEVYKIIILNETTML